MKNWLVRWLASAMALYALTLANVGIMVDNPWVAIVAVIALGLANSLIRPLIMFFVWPINCLTFGLLGFAVNVLLFWLVGSGFLHGFHVSSARGALIGSVAMGIMSGLINFLLKDRGERR